MSRHFTIGMAAAMALCFLLAGCGGGGGGGLSADDQARIDKAEADALAAQEALRKAQEQQQEEEKQETEADTKRDQQVADLTAAITAITAALAADETAAATTDDDETETDTATDDATEVVTPTTPTTPTTPPTPPTPTTPTIAAAEANQRATNLRTIFGDPEAITMPLNPVTVKITAPSKGSLTLKRGGYSTAALSGKGLRSTTMALTVGGDTGKTVVYTDRELTRLLLDHYGEFKPSNVDQFRVDGTASTDSAGFIVTAETPAAGAFPGTVTAANNVADRVITDKAINAFVSLTHGLRSSIGGSDRTYAGAVNNNRYDSDTDGDIDTDDDFRGTDTSRTLASTNEYFAGSVHGVGGRFYCTGTTNCMITVRGGVRRVD